MDKKKTSLQDMKVDMNPEWSDEEQDKKDLEEMRKLEEERARLGRKKMQGVE